MYYGDWGPYVSVKERLANAREYAKKLAKKAGRDLAPAETKARKLATTFWGLAWCENLNRFRAIESRLSRGATYLKNGSVVDMWIEPGIVQAVVAGRDVYEVRIKIDALTPKVWKALKQDVAQSIHSLLDLLQGKFDEPVMQRLSQTKTGLFPEPKEMSLDCSCPDGAHICKHIAAVVYGIGVRLDTAPELLFKLRQVDHSELVTQALAKGNLEQTLAAPTADVLAGSDLSELFGIDLGSSTTPESAAPLAATPALKKSRNRRAASAPVEVEAVAPRKATAKKEPRKAAVPTAKKKTAAAGKGKTPAKLQKSHS